MAGAGELGEVQSFPLDGNESGFDDRGHVLIAAQDGNDTVRSVDLSTDSDASGTADDLEGQYPLGGVLYSNTVPDKRNVTTGEYPESGEVDVTTESRAALVLADAETYNLGDDVYLSSSNAGYVNGSESGNVRVGRVAEANDLSGGAGLLKVSFSTF